MILPVSTVTQYYWRKSTSKWFCNKVCSLTCSSDFWTDYLRVQAVRTVWILFIAFLCNVSSLSFSKHFGWLKKSCDGLMGNDLSSLLFSFPLPHRTAPSAHSRVKLVKSDKRLSPIRIADRRDGGGRSGDLASAFYRALPQFLGKLSFESIGCCNYCFTFSRHNHS